MNKFTVGAIAVLILLFGGLVYYTTRQSESVDYSKYDPNTLIEATKDNGDIGDHVRGKTDSPVILIEYADLQCPGCAASYPSVDELYEEYNDRVAFVYRNFPLSAHKNARAAAAAVESAGYQGYYWEMLTELYDQRNLWLDLTGGERTNRFAELFKEVAPDGDVDKFRKDISDEKIEKKIKKLKKAKQLIEKDYLPRKEKYEKAKATFNGRNSYSKTDEDATFMRMKEDAMQNGQLKPGYNVQVGTENNFVIGYDVFPNPTDTRTLKPHIENVEKRLNCKLKTVIADAGYGSEENYDYLEEKGIIGVIKYSSYEKEIKRSFKKNTFNAENWNYDSELKEYTCPCGNAVPYKETRKRKNPSGYEQTVDIYKCDNYEGCPFRELCTKSEYGRMVQRNENWLNQKAKVKELLATDEYKSLMKKRSTECETVFGQIKSNQKFRRFNLCGKQKVETEWGLLMLGYNVKQLIRLMNA